MFITQKPIEYDRLNSHHELKAPKPLGRYWLGLFEINSKPWQFLKNSLIYTTKTVKHFEYAYYSLKKVQYYYKKSKLISLLCCLAPNRIPRLYTFNWLRLRELRTSTDVIGNSIENNKSHIQFKVHSNVIFPPLSTLLCRRKHLSYFYKRISVKRVIRLTTFSLHRKRQDLGLRFHDISLKLCFFFSFK